MKSKHLIGAFAIAAAGFSLPASAQMTMPSLSSAYIGASLGQADLDFDCAGSTGCDTKDTAWRIFGGFQLNRTFSAELGYANLGEARFDDPVDPVTVEGTAWDLSAIGAIPIGPVSVFGRLGLYRAEVEASGPGGSADASSTGLLWGIGAQFDFTKNLGVRAEWQQYNDVEDDVGTKADVNVISVGVVWRFQ